MHPTGSCREHPDFPNAWEALFFWGGICKTRALRKGPGLPRRTWIFLPTLANAPFSHRSLGTRPWEITDSFKCVRSYKVPRIV